jgi:hypothetical protein
MSPDEARLLGLQLAVDLYADWEPDGLGDREGQLLAAVTDAACHFAHVLTGRPHRLRLFVAPFTFAEGPPGPGVPTIRGDNMSVTMSDNQEVSYSVEAEDSRGFPVTDALTWSESTGGAVVTATPAADGMSCVFASVAPGESTITVTDGTLSASDVVTVVAGPVAELVLTPGTPTPEPAPAAPPA